MHSRILRWGGAAGVGFMLAALGTAMFCPSLVGRQAQAGVIRHDVPDSQYTDLAAQPEYAAVGRVDRENAGPTSGNLVSSRWGLTAGHVANAVAADLGNPMTDPPTFTIDGISYEVVEAITHPSWTGSIESGIDVGLLRLEVAVSDVTPAVRYAGSSNLLGSTGTFVGYGRTGTGLTGQGSGATAGTKRAGQNVLNVLGGAMGVPNISSNYLLSDFDNPNTSADSKWGSATPLPLEYLVATGDSGGGMFVEIGGVNLLAGVHSFIGEFDGDLDADYGDFMGVARVSVANDWIDDTIAAKWNNASGGSAHTAGNWQIGNAANTLLPDSTDILSFNLPGSYTVSFTGANTYNKILARRGTVTLNLGGATQTVNSAMQNGSVTVGRDSGDNAQLILTNGTLAATDAFIGRSSGSTGTITLTGAGTQWTLSDSLYLGGSNSAAGGTGTLTVNAGTSVQISNTLKLWSSNATVNVNGGALIVGQFDFAAGRLMLSGGTVASAAPVVVQSGSIEGSGTIDADVQTNGIISPGTSVGHLTFEQDFALQSDAQIVIELGGLNPGVTHDLVTVNGALEVDGLLQLSFLDGFPTTLTSSDTFTIVTSGSPISGNFLNAANNMRLVTADGAGSFVVHYGPGSIFAAENIVLTDFLATTPGDFDGDGDVDGADFVIWQTNFPTQTGATLATGDADGDGDVDGADFVIWQTNFPTTPAPGVALASLAPSVPEPSAGLLALLALLGYIARPCRSGVSRFVSDRHGRARHPPDRHGRAM